MSLMFPMPAWTGLASSLKSQDWQMQQSLQRLTTLRRLNSAADDAAGSAIASRMVAHLTGMMTAERSVQDGVSLTETADGALGQVGDALQRMRDLAVQSRNGTLSASDRAHLQSEYDQLGQQVNQTLGSTQFNGKRILGADAGKLTFQIGADSSDTLSLTTTDLTKDASLKAATAAQVGTDGGAKSAIDGIDQALKTLGNQRATLGAAGNRLGAIADSLDLQVVTGSAAYARTTEADMNGEWGRLHSTMLQRDATLMLLKQQFSLQGTTLSLFA